eukprot:scaffold50495_cov26-Tisochrysis_lutea.AAC.1
MPHVRRSLLAACCGGFGYVLQQCCESRGMLCSKLNRLSGVGEVGKPAAALADALMAVQLDPKFFKAVSRAATCHC